MFLGLALLVVAGCAKTTTYSGISAKEYFDAWMTVNYPELLDSPTPLGAYVIEDIPGTGALVGDYENSPYIRVEYTSYSLDGDVTATSYKTMAQQIGTYVEYNYYGPRIWTRLNNTLYAGVDEAVSTMYEGGRKLTIIPGWLFTSLRYDTAEEYIANVSGTNAIYDITVIDTIQNIVQWQLDSIEAYLQRNFPGTTLDDSLKFGFYYIQETEPDDTTAFPTDSSIYINYIARRLDGWVFDTNIQDTAKRYGLYSSSTTYEPTLINWDEDDYTAMTMTSDESSMIDGFAYCLWNMRSHERGTCIFYSSLGYGASGSGDVVPEFAPLVFDIEIVDEE